MQVGKQGPLEPCRKNSCLSEVSYWSAQASCSVERWLNDLCFLGYIEDMELLQWRDLALDSSVMVQQFAVDLCPGIWLWVTLSMLGCFHVLC